MLNAGYRYFYAIAQERSIRRAADRTHISASAMSRQIALLEDELGPLLERRSRGVVLTAAGKLLAEHIRRLMIQEQGLRTDISELRGLRSGHVRIALGNGFAASVATFVGSRFAAEHPEMTYSLTVAPSDEILRLVDEEEVDIGLTFDAPPHQTVEIIDSYAAPLHVVAPLGHHLARFKKGIPLSALESEAMALLKPSHRIRQILQKVEIQEGVRLTAKAESNSYEVLKILVASKVGVTVLPRLSVLAELRSKKLVAVPIEHNMLCSTSASLVIRRGRKLPAAASEFIKLLQEQVLGAAN